MFDAPTVVTFADIQQTHSWAEAIAEPERVAAKAFCERCYSGRGSTYRVRGLIGPAKEIKGTRARACPSCGHALYWSRNYTEIVPS